MLYQVLPPQTNHMSETAHHHQLLQTYRGPQLARIVEDHVFTKKLRGWNRKPHTRCESCWKKNRFNTKQAGDVNSTAYDNDDSFGQISSITSVLSAKQPKKLPTKTKLNHHLFTKGEWRRARITEHPQVPLTIALDNLSSKPVDVMAVADTGAQSDLWSLQKFLDAGFTMADLSPVSLSLHAANKSPIRIAGAFFAKLQGQPRAGNTVSCRSMMYVSQDVKSLYLSYDSMLELGIINPDFPKVGKCISVSKLEHHP